MESMDPGQLSIALYSVCKITNLNTESHLWVFLLLLRIMSVFICFKVIQVLAADDSGGWF